jgi:hypothetical protein
VLSGPHHAAQRNPLDSHITRWQGPQPADQVNQRQQAIDGERAAAIPNDRERIGRHDAGPPGRQREQIPVLVMQMDPVLTPVLAVRDKLEVLAERRGSR